MSLDCLCWVSGGAVFSDLLHPSETQRDQPAHGKEQRLRKSNKMGKSKKDLQQAAVDTPRSMRLMKAYAPY